MPDSPRQLVRAGKIEGARQEFEKIRRDLKDQELEEFSLMRTQIEYEMQGEITSYVEIFKIFKQRMLV
jgi:hypothetical protein